MFKGHLPSDGPGSSQDCFTNFGPSNILRCWIYGCWRRCQLFYDDSMVNKTNPDIANLCDEATVASISDVEFQ